MTRPVINLDEIELKSRPAAYAATGDAANRYDATMGQIGRRIGAKQLGYNVTAIPPGKRAFPVHSHRVNEEMFLIIHGSGEVRIGADSYPLRAGDIVACPAGGVETAHQIVNTGTEELRFLAVSTMGSPELCEYPDSGKFGVYADFYGAADGKPRSFRHIGREFQSIDYWEDE